ncbi:hypothetical protein [Roseateles oligotrophus]|uniref:Uncharacterized protein n=1 Tax=Roseateles oligotrophus TaxID=1769250 RepID=A0ABT2YMN1_9BURK|nr:hypothetical protein [Roseateles oligotrophus]MCV2371328.1 hypothetical protein [Roseateles oligotrophus]
MLHEPRLSFVLLHDAMICIKQDQLALADQLHRCHAGGGRWLRMRARLQGARAFVAPRIISLLLLGLALLAALAVLY